MSNGRNRPTGEPRRSRACHGIEGEPSLDELIDDPVMQAIMMRDGVGRADLIELIDQVRARLEKRPAYALDMIGQ